jgi:hypothetical protein
MRFVGRALHDLVLDAKTIWLYREQLARDGTVGRPFARFDALLRAKGLAGHGQADHPDETTARRFRHCSNGTVWRSGCSIRYCGTLQGR